MPAGKKPGAPDRCHNLGKQNMKTRNISATSALISAFLTSCVTKPQRICTILVFVLALVLIPSSAFAFTFTTFDSPDATFTQGIGINSPGDIVGVYEDAVGMRHGFLLAEGIFTTIDGPGATFTSAIGINSAGRIVGVYDDGTGVSHGYVWAKGTIFRERHT